MIKKNYLFQENPKYNNLIDTLVSVSVDTLQEMYIPEKYDFFVKKKLLNNKIHFEESSIRYTLINLIGLYKAESNNIKINIDLEEILSFHISRADKLKGIGELGLLLWATSLISPNKLNNILTKINFNDILTKYEDASKKLTMELSWFLTGILMASTFSEVFKVAIGKLPEKVYTILRNNYGSSGIFSHQSTNTISGKFRGNLASFADQVYPIYVLSLYSKLKNNHEASLIADECATKLCELQGENGEWFWHYNSKTGKVISKFPIYSVHQDAMAPMALFAVQRATGNNYEKYIYKGLDWIINQNLLNENIYMNNENIICRAIQPSKTHRKFRATLSHLGLSPNEDYNNLSILKESWSYHFGWILFAFAGKINNPKVNKIEEQPFNNFRIFSFN